MKKRMLIILSLVMYLALSGILFAGEDDSKFYGSFMFGYRFVDVDGTESKYMEDLNLNEGARLFNFSLNYSPDGKAKKLFDHLSVSAYNLGGDPFQSFSLDVVKYGTYKFQYDRKKSTYFYADNLAGHDYHTYDFDRIHDSGLLKVTLGQGFKAYLGFDRYTKEGSSVSTLDIGRVEFEFDKPIDELSSEVTLGIEYNSKQFSFVIEDKFVDYNNANSMFLPGFADGGDHARYPTNLLYFNLNQPYNMSGNTITAKFTGSFIKNLMIKGSMQKINQDTTFTYFENAMGADYVGADFKYSQSGEGEFSRDMEAFNLDVSYILTDKFALIGALRYQNFDQKGSIEVDSVRSSMDLKYETGGVEGGLQFQPSNKIGLTLGYRFEQRDVKDAIEIEEENAATSRNGMFGTLLFKLAKGFKLTADYHYGSYENPLTLISPTDFHRFRLTAKYRSKGFYANGSYLFNKTESDQGDYMWESSKNQFNLRMGYRDKKFSLSGGYSLIDVTQAGDRQIFYPPTWSGGAGSFLWDILYEGQSNLYDLYGYLKLCKTWGVGAYLNYYQNTGSWELTRTNFRAFLKYEFKTGLIGQLAYRMVDYQEEDAGLNDYKVNIVEVSFGYKW